MAVTAMLFRAWRRNTAGCLCAAVATLQCALAHAQAPHLDPADAAGPVDGAPMQSAVTDREAAKASETMPYAELVDQAVAEFGSGHFAESRALFERAHAVNPNARTLRGLGITAFELRRYTQAEKELEAALIDTRNALTTELRAEVEAALKRARDFVGTVEIRVQPNDARVLVDGAEVPERKLELDVGEYDVVVTAAGYRAASVRVRVSGGRHQAVELRLFEIRDAASPADARRQTGPTDPDPAAPAMYTRWWFWAGAAALIGGGIAATVLLTGGAEQRGAEPGSVGGVVQVLGARR